MQRLAEIEVTAGELEAARAGDREARRALFERVAPATLGIIRRLVAQRALAEDLLQDTLIAMFEHLGEFRGEAPFGVWVRSIAVSRCLMSFRSPWHRARVALESFTGDAEPWPVEAESRTEELIDLERALAKLSPVTRAVAFAWISSTVSASSSGKRSARSIPPSPVIPAGGGSRLVNRASFGCLSSSMAAGTPVSMWTAMSAHCGRVSSPESSMVASVGRISPTAPPRVFTTTVASPSVTVASAPVTGGMGRR